MKIFILLLLLMTGCFNNKKLKQSGWKRFKCCIEPSSNLYKLNPNCDYIFYINDKGKCFFVKDIGQVM